MNLHFKVQGYAWKLLVRNLYSTLAFQKYQLKINILRIAVSQLYLRKMLPIDMMFSSQKHLKTEIIIKPFCFLLILSQFKQFLPLLIQVAF